MADVIRYLPESAPVKKRPFFSGMSRPIAASLTARVLLIALLLVSIAAVLGYLAFSRVAQATATDLAAGLAEKQILYDRARGLSELQREVALAESIAVSQPLIKWLRDEHDTAKKTVAIEELRRNRELFAGRTYFAAVAASQHYYYEDAGAFNGDSRPHYSLEPDSPRDSWYFETLALGKGCHLNVDNDAVAGGTKVFINCVVVDDGKAIGMVGTALDFSSFVGDVITDTQPGVSVFFIDGDGAVKAHSDPRLVDYRSVTRRVGQRKTAFQMFGQSEDRATFERMMEDVGSGHVAARSEFLEMDGRRVLVGVGYLKGLGWYNVAVMDVNLMVDRNLFLPIGLLVVAIVVAGGVLLTMLFKRSVLDPLTHLEVSVRAAEKGDLKPGERLDLKRRDEIGRLSRAFVAMSRAVNEHTRLLEARVQERTQELEQLAYRDAGTGLANRRAFIDYFKRAQRERQDEPIAIVLIDIDHFKQINDRHGHLAGDAVVAEVARRLQAVLRTRELCARWGGDEFIVLLWGYAGPELQSAVLRVVSAVSRHPVELPGSRIQVELSVGVHVVDPVDTIENATEKADAAMYRAKEAGRARVVFAEEGVCITPRHGGHHSARGRARGMTEDGLSVTPQERALVQRKDTASEDASSDASGNTSRSSIPGDWRRPASSHLSAASTTTPWPRRSTASTRPR